MTHPNMVVLWLIITAGIFILRPPFLGSEVIACARAYPQTHDARCMGQAYPIDEHGSEPIEMLWEYRLSLFAED